MVRLNGLARTATACPAGGLTHGHDRLLVHLTSCDARREQVWEKVAWWDFIRAEEMSEEYRTLLGIGQQFATNRIIGAPVVKQVRPPAERRLKSAGAGRSEDARKA